MDEDFSSIAFDKLEIELSCHVVQKGVILSACDNRGFDLLDTIRTPPPDFVFDEGASHIESEILDISYAAVSCFFAVVRIQFGVVRMKNRSYVLKISSAGLPLEIRIR